jgi:Flp pilus assembly pilin Flp
MDIGARVSNLQLHSKFIEVAVRVSNRIWSLRERALSGDGQTMTEYALLLSAVAVVVYTGYKQLGNNVINVINKVDSNL